MGYALCLGFNFANPLNETDASCVSKALVLPLGLVLSLTALIAKTYRIHVIFNSKYLTVKKLTDATLIKIVAAIIAPQVVLY